MIDHIRREECQYTGIAKVVRSLEYRQIKKIDMENKSVLEIGPGGKMDHIKWWNGKPKLYTALDVDEEYLDNIGRICRGEDIEYKLINSWDQLYDQYDIIMAFNVLEHLMPIDFYLEIINCGLRDDGIFIGSFPTEGGVMWRLGRRLCTWNRMKKLGLNPEYEVAKNHQTCARCIIAGFERIGLEVKFGYWSMPRSINLSVFVNFSCLKNKGG